MITALADDRKPWRTIAQDRPGTLTIVLLKRTFVLPWNQFLFAEGSDEELRLVFSTHDIILRGAQLSQLLADLSAQRVDLLREPGRADAFRPDFMPHIASISVEKVE
jgi:hypothetical protein